MSSYLKDPDATLDYLVEWGAGYLETQVIATSDWWVLPVEVGGVTVVAMGATATRANVTLTGGVPGHVYRVTNAVGFNDGRSDERSVIIRVEAR